MWGGILADDSSNLTTIYAAGIGAFGVVMSAYLASRRQDRTTREVSQRTRPRASKEQRLERLEQWRRQYAQPLLRKTEQHLKKTEADVDVFDWEEDGDK